MGIKKFLWLVGVGVLVFNGCRTAGTRGADREIAVDVEMGQPQPRKAPPATPSPESRPEFRQEPSGER